MNSRKTALFPPARGISAQRWGWKRAVALFGGQVGFSPDPSSFDSFGVGQSVGKGGQLRQVELFGAGGFRLADGGQRGDDRGF